VGGPAFSALLHDLGINGVGYVTAKTARVQRQDAVPATARAALGEGRFDSYQIESFMAQATWEGGAGQARLVAQDSFLGGYCEGAFPGHLFPARARQVEGSGGTASWYFTRQPLGAAPVLYGITAATINLIGTGTTRARTAGAITCKPVVSGSQNVYWTQGSAGARALFQWDGNIADAPANVTSRLGGATDVCVVGRYERALWALGLGTPATTAAVVQSKHATFANVANASITLSTATTAGNLIVLIVASEDAGAPTPQPLPETSWHRIVSDSTGTAMSTMFYYKNAPQMATIDVDFAEIATVSRLAVLEIEGCDTAAPLVVSDSVTRAASQDMSTPTVNATSTGIAVAAMFTDGGGTGDTTGYTNSYVEALDFGNTFNELAVATKVLSATGNTSTAATTTATAGNVVVLIATFKQTTLPASSIMFKAWRTVDEGATWADIFPTTSTGISEPRAAVALGGFLYFTTATGLYALAAEEHEFEDHQKSIIVALKGPLDRWDVPYSSDMVAPAGQHLDVFDGILYYNVGATVRFYAPNGTGQQLWPPPSWGWVVGEVRHVIAGEFGIYFAAAGVLWRYNGRGFMPLFKQTNSGEFDYLHWFQGRLYAKADPAIYYKFIYPSSRPDVAGLTVSDLTTGYVVTSKIDFEKVAEYKVLRTFDTHAQFSATSDSGTITLEYRNADTGLHPDAYLPDDATITWTSIGTHTIADGNVKQFTISPPAELRAIFLRATLAVGASGYPILEAMIADGRAVMPAVHRFTATLDLSTDAKDRSGAAMYTGASEVNAAVDELFLVMSGTPRYLTLAYVDDDDTATSYTVTREQSLDQLREHGHEGAASPQLDLPFTVSFLEIP
jgi:hypothetical protein